jgi:histidine triad (HIT) family protein
MADCIFCRIAAGEVPARIAYQDDRAVAFHDRSPQAPLHLLIIPRHHIPNLAAVGEGDEPLLGHLLNVARQLAEGLGVAGSGYRVVVNVGPDAGQSVDHMHVHLLARRVMAWPPG